MDPNPKRFPVLSYVMSRLQPAASQSASDHDIEAPAPAPTTAAPSFPTISETELFERMPQLSHPDILASMARAVSDVAQTRSVLRALGKRPSHEAVDAVRSRLADIDANLLLHDGDMECLGKAEAEKLPYKAIVKLEEMHEAYESLLREAEERLVKIYRSVAEGGVRKAEKEEEEEGEEVDEDIVSILKQAPGKCAERVELSGRRLRLLPEEFGRMRGLVSLDVSNNRLEAIPDAIAGLEQLEELSLSSNYLVSLPDSIGLLFNLKTLDVSSNKLKALPDSISYCRSLVELNASYNELTYLPTNIGYELENLQKLWIFLNKLRSLPTSICEMKSLRLLDAHFNELSGLPYAIGKLTSLETLNLSSNFSDMKELPPTFGDLINLKELDLSNNQIHALPDSFGHLEKLSILKLEQNPLVIPPMEIVNQGVQAVKMYMSKRWLDILIEEEQKNQIVESPKLNAGWLTRSTSWLSNFATGVSGGIAEYLGAGETSYKDPCLDQQL